MSDDDAAFAAALDLAAIRAQYSLPDASLVNEALVRRGRADITALLGRIEADAQAVAQLRDALRAMVEWADARFPDGETVPARKQARAALAEPAVEEVS